MEAILACSSRRGIELAPGAEADLLALAGGPLEAPSSSAWHRRNTVATEAVLLVMVVLRVAGWHLPSPAANQEASFDILFDVAATLDKENKWWASVPLRALKVKLPSSG